MAAVAAMGIVGSANAGWFVIENASVSGSAGGTTPANGTIMNVANLGLPNSTGNTLQTLTAGPGGSFDAITSSLGSLGNNTITYFGLENGAAGPGFFGFAFKAVTWNYTLNINLTSAFGVPAGDGMFVGYSNDGGATVSAVGTYDGASYDYSLNPVFVGANFTLIVLFAGLYPDSAVSGSISTVGGGTFDVDYLSYESGSWASLGNATNTSFSNLNIATYAIPVPAPMLLAGVGLVGAAVLRRRMTKVA